MQASTNYIYIVFAVAYAIYSVVKAGKKVTANRPTTTSSNPTSATEQSRDDFKPVKPPIATPIPQHTLGDDLKKMLEDLMGESREVHEPEVLVPKPKQIIATENSKHRQPESRFHSAENQKNNTHLLEKEKLKSVHTEQATVKSKPVFRSTIVEPEVEDPQEVNFDMRQAIIYSEILKRPEY
jgi:hypothetical protein